MSTVTANCVRLHFFTSNGQRIYIHNREEFLWIAKDYIAFFLGRYNFLNLFDRGSAAMIANTIEYHPRLSWREEVEKMQQSELLSNRILMVRVVKRKTIGRYLVTARSFPLEESCLQLPLVLLRSHKNVRIESSLTQQLWQISIVAEAIDIISNGSDLPKTALKVTLPK